MTDKNYCVYKYLISYIKENGYPPSYMEIGEALNIVHSVVLKHLKKLEKEGWIELKPKSPRAIKIIGYKFVFDTCLL